MEDEKKSEKKEISNQVKTPLTESGFNKENIQRKVRLRETESNVIADIEKPSKKLPKKAKKLRKGPKKIKSLEKVEDELRTQDPMTSEVKVELGQGVLRYTRIQQSLDKKNAIINDLGKQLKESRKENQKLKTSIKKLLSKKDLEIETLKASRQNIFNIVETLRKKQALLKENIIIEIKEELKNVLNQKLDFLDKIEQSQPAIETIAEPLANKIQELELLIQQKNYEIDIYLDEKRKTKYEITRLQRINERLEKAYNRINKQNKALQEELQRYLEDNEVLKKELDRINEELSK
ncbi:MAG: hypothetical protein HWN66_19200 [Candidatus Helarchaeota archaeon]|nr:hypothetical protein [Candidatus Helarchaeota archaeon]